MNSSFITLRPDLIQKKSRHIVVIIDVKRLVILNALAVMTLINVMVLSYSWVGLKAPDHPSCRAA